MQVVTHAGECVSHTSKGVAAILRCGFHSVRYLKVKIHCINALGRRIVSAVLSFEVVTSKQLPMYYKYGIFNL